MKRRSILVAPLNWGLGHAARCIPIIHQLEEANYKVIIASDGNALEFLRKEFPKHTHYELPELNITYSKNGFWLKLKLLSQLKHLYTCIAKEQEVLQDIIQKEDISGIISDNRLGLHHAEIPSVIISHQLTVLSGSLTWLSSKMHQRFIKKYKECWVPDFESRPNLSGRLGHLETSNFPIKYLGLISRFEREKTNLDNDILVILSGPEPQRTALEDLLVEKLKTDPRQIILVQGKVEAHQQQSKIGNIKRINYTNTKTLEQLILRSKLIIARSGYTSIMDLAKLDKQVFFIPTPGQSEQEYLASRLEKYGISPYSEQHKFEVSQLERLKTYKGLGSWFRDRPSRTISDLFCLFNRE